MNNSELSPITIFGYDRPNHLNNLLESLTKNSEWIIVGSRYGSSREERLIRETLEELGCFTKYPSNNYDCSKRLIKHLTTLGWPIDKFLEFRSIG